MSDNMTVQEPLRDRVGRALYEEPGRETELRDWYNLSEERREPWRKDADRVIAIVQTEPNTPYERAQTEINLLTSRAEKAKELILRNSPRTAIAALNGEYP